MDIERKLASVRRIAAIEPIDGADNIICVTVDGWKLVSAKTNGFQVGELVLYFEIDAFLPVRPEFEWMRDRCYKNTAHLGEGFRVKTIKLRGQISQGLVVPLSDFFQKMGDNYVHTSVFGTYTLVEGWDLTEELNVKKWEKPESGPGGSKFGPMNTRGDFPSFLRKTDEERAQNCWGGIKKWILYGKPEVTEVTSEEEIAALEAIDSSTHFFKSGDMWFEKITVNNTPEVVQERSRFEATLKLDGSSMTIYHNEGQLGVCSRNQDLKRNPNNAFWKVAIDTGLLGYLAQSGENIAVQGELMGPGVQGNRENLDALQMFVFNVFDIDQQRYFTPAARRDWLDNLSLRHAPVLVASLNFEGDEDIDYFLEIADNTKSLNHAIAEGIVFKSHVADGPSFKIISNKFLLKEKD